LFRKQPGRKAPVIKIKICGLFREADVEAANEAGPDFAGFVFAESRRRVSQAEASRLRSRLREGIISVGVFVNAPPEEVAALYRDGLIGMAQLHGGEDAAHIRRLKTLSAAGGLAQFPVIKALRVDGLAGKGWDNPAADAISDAADYLLLDSGSGSGKRFDWSLLEHPSRDGVPDFRKPWFLAGGICRENIGLALSYRPFAVDVSSGAETNGIKDREKMIALVRMTREERV
jgi:phosphoribosylanthranilate isomerase